MRSGVCGLLLCLVALPASAVTFKASIEQSSWELEASQFFCRLQQSVPSYGTAQFEHEAGETVKFMLTSTQKQQHADSARLIAEAAPWMPGIAPEFIAQIKPDSKGTLEVDGEEAVAMLSALYRGMNPTFNERAWYGTNEPVKIGISAVNFQSAYNDYLGCVSGLLPVNYRQVARTALLFPSAGWTLPDSAKERLDDIVLYIKADSTVKSIYVDGHSDNYGRRLLNRDLSKRRAEAVTQYLISQGMPETMIITRYHGDRYPVVPNNSAANRARNRRVTVRLEREE